MKKHRKFLIFLLIITVFSAAAAIWTTNISLSRIRKAENSSMQNLISKIKEVDPNISENEIAEILNKKIHNSTKTDLTAYGITEKDWLSIDNEDNSKQAVCLAGTTAFFMGLIFVFAMEIYHISEKKGIKKLTGYLTKINSGNNDLEIETNSEDEQSILKNEIYKTAVMLREQSEHDKIGKVNLKDSISDISHQLKTPLTSIIITVDNLLDDPDIPPDLRKEFLQDIKQASENISFLVQSLLTLSKLDADSIEMKIKPEKAFDVFGHCISSTEIIADIHEVTLLTEDNEAEINCDLKWFSEALINIVKNCVEHTPQGGYVKLECKENKLYTAVTVTDNGCGISKDDLPHIFERFYKGKNSSENSVGIGLALAKAIVEKHNGYITVDSELNKGSVFTIKIMNIKS